MENANKKGRWFGSFKKLIIVLGIIIVLNLFFNYGVRTFYDSPEYEDYCTTDITTKRYSIQEDCENAGGLWSENFRYPLRGEKIIPTEEEVTEPAGWCNVAHTCAMEFDDVNNVYKRNVFIILVIAGILSLLVGFFISTAEAVALGFSFGGILSLIIGTLRYWSAMQDYLRFIVLGIALLALVWLGIKKISD